MNHRFENVAVPFLDELTHRVKVSREINRCRENAFEVLALGLAEELLPPFGYKMQRRLIVHENFRYLAFTVQRIARSRILVSLILGQIRVAVLLGCVSRTFHHGIDVNAGCRDWKQAYCC
ncbi:hypothetical protein D3C78_1272180 [compost metagenome]